MFTILLINSDADVADELKTQLQISGAKVVSTYSLKEAEKRIPEQDFTLCICERALMDGTCFDLLSQFSKQAFLITDANPSVEHAVSALKAGAVDYIQQKNAKHTAKTITINGHLESPSTTRKEMIGDCEAMKQVYYYIERTAPTDCNVLILGETGTGKELVAKSIHGQSTRKMRPLISVNCAAIPETLIESELFGYEKGAFTGANTSREGLIEAANGGTLFLDEIGELPLEAQARLLRFIQEGEIRRIGSVKPIKVDVRLIAATHRDLKKLSSENRFREDLFYRINVMQIDLPPLRNRGEDILKIANALLERCCLKLRHPIKAFSEQAENLMMRYKWPGNIRELENIIERAVILSETDQTVIDEDTLAISPATFNKNVQPPIRAGMQDQLSNQHLSAIKKEASDTQKPKEEPKLEGSQNLSLEDYFMKFVLKHQDSMSETELARKLGVSRKCLWERRQRLGIPRKKSAKS